MVNLAIVFPGFSRGSEDGSCYSKKRLRTAVHSKSGHRPQAHRERRLHYCKQRIMMPFHFWWLHYRWMSHILGDVYLGEICLVSTMILLDVGATCVNKAAKHSLSRTVYSTILSYFKRHTFQGHRGLWLTYTQLPVPLAPLFSISTFLWHLKASRVASFGVQFRRNCVHCG